MSQKPIVLFPGYIDTFHSLGIRIGIGIPKPTIAGPTPKKNPTYLDQHPTDLDLALISIQT